MSGPHTRGQHKPRQDAVPAGAKISSLPARLSPQLLSGPTESALEGGPEWLYEIKLDGYRILARIDGAAIQLFTRHGNNWTSELAYLRDLIRDARLPPGWYDGELVVCDDTGRPDFSRISEALRAHDTSCVVYYLFDVPFLNGYDLRGCALDARRAKLEEVLAQCGTNVIRFSRELQGPPIELLEAACEMKLEGIVGKRRDAPYVSRRSRTWVKLKCWEVGEFLVLGYTRTRHGVGKLYLGMPDAAGAITYVGSTSSGLSDAQRSMLRDAFDLIGSDIHPFPGLKFPVWVRWVRPLISAQVSFAEWTRDRRLRHAVVKRLDVRSES